MLKGDYIKIGNRLYRKELVEKLNSEYQELILKWQNFAYSKWSCVEEHLQFAVIESLLFEKYEITYVQTSGRSEYPSFPLNNFDFAKSLVTAAEDAKILISRFQIPERKSFEGSRQYIGRIADVFENYCLSKELKNAYNSEVASLAADTFLRLSAINSSFLTE